MRNQERERILQSFADLYFPSEVDDMLRRMPTEKVDPDGSLFDEYFGMIQTVANAPHDKTLSTDEKKVLEARMRLVARKYGYPSSVSIALDGENVTNT